MFSGCGPRIVHRRGAELLENPALHAVASEIHPDQTANLQLLRREVSHHVALSSEERFIQVARCRWGRGGHYGASILFVHLCDLRRASES